MKVMFVVTHLLGSGHLSRALTLARAFKAADHEVIVVSGGMPAPHLDHDGLQVIQLLPLRSDGVDFTRLLDADGALTSADYLASRQVQLLQILAQEAPDVVITELFPFGRRILRDEFVAVLKAAHLRPQRTLVLASIRDILAPPSKPKKAAFAQDMITKYYDGVLVHADPDITPLDLSWPVDDLLEPFLKYTGFVAPPPAAPHPTAAGTGEVIVTAGGGDVGDALFAAASDAARRDPTRIWRLLIGGKTAPQHISRLLQSAPTNLVAEHARPDFRQMLHHAAASVSMCGYNTAQDVLQTSCPAVFVPFDAGQEVEQSIRAKALHKLDAIAVLATVEMTSDTLLGAVNSVVTAPRRTALPAANGAAQTVEIVEKMYRVATL